MLQPKRTKYRKVHRGRLKGARPPSRSMPSGSPGGQDDRYVDQDLELRPQVTQKVETELKSRAPGRKSILTVPFGDIALQALEPCWLTGRQIEAGRRVISRRTRRGGRSGKIWIHPFPDKPVTFRPPETRMGSGKGAPEYWVAVVKPGQILYEIKGIPISIAREALKTAGYKMPIRTKIITRNDTTSKLFKRC